MGDFPATKAKKVLAALLRIGWKIKRQSGGSHRILYKEGWKNHVFAYHKGEEVGPDTLKQIAKETGLKPEDL